LVTKDGAVYRERCSQLPAWLYGLEEILRHNILPSPAVMFRNGIHRELPAWYFDDAVFYEHVESIVPARWRRIARAEKGRRYVSIAYLLRKQRVFRFTRGGY
jgi:hypothetical protein